MGPGRSYKPVGAGTMGVRAAGLYSVLVLSGPIQVQFCIYHLHCMQMECYDSADQVIPSSLKELHNHFISHDQVPWSRFSNGELLAEEDMSLL